jgi:UDP-glucose 4-epimerase
MKVLVTGGAGYIGAELVYQLSLDTSITEIIVYDNLSNGNQNLFISASHKIKSGNVRFVFGDLLDSRLLLKTMKGVNVVYHLAAKVASPYRNEDSHAFEQVNNWGTSEVALAVEETKSVKKLVYVSSVGVYGSTPKGSPADEETGENPKTFYAVSKMRGEDHVKRLMGKIDVVIIRAANVYGYTPAIRFDSVINTFLFEANFNKRIQIHGSGKQARTFIHVNKLVFVLKELLGNKVPSGVYNLGDISCSLLDLIDIFKEVYPNLEFIFINQHLQLRNLEIDTNNAITKYIPLKPADLKAEVLAFKENNFAF